MEEMFIPSPSFHGLVEEVFLRYAHGAYAGEEPGHDEAAEDQDHPHRQGEDRHDVELHFVVGPQFYGVHKWVDGRVQPGWFVLLL